MKKAFALACAMLILGAALAASAEGAVYGKDIKDGTYKIEVESSSSMFRIVDCELTVADGEMTALMTLSGSGYEKLFMGTGEEASSAPDSEFTYFKENADGKYTYAAPVAALNADIPCAAFSIRRQRWYDRTLVFKADTLPESALKSGASAGAAIGAVVGAALAAAVIALILNGEKKKKKKNEGH